MNPYMTQTPNANDVALVESIVSQRLKGSILWMVVGLLTTLGYWCCDANESVLGALCS